MAYGFTLPFIREKMVKHIAVTTILKDLPWHKKQFYVTHSSFTILKNRDWNRK